MRHYFRLVFLLGVMLLSVACYEGPKAELRSVSVDRDTLLVPVSGIADFYFTVNDPGYDFDLDNDVVLYLAKGQFLASQYFFLSRVERDTLPGRYRAFVTDRGVRDDYNEEVCIGVRLPDGVMKLSPIFRCVGEFGGPDGPARKTGLPILYLNTQYGAKILSKEDYVKATVTLHDGDEVTDELPCNVRGRGNTTWYWP